MTLAVDLRDPETFPSRRAEAWRWTDLRRALRETPTPSPAATVAPGGPFAALGGTELAVVNGQCEGAPTLTAAVGEMTARLRFVATGAGGGHQQTVDVSVQPGAHLILLETYEGLTDGYVSNIALNISVGDGARLTRLVLADDRPDAISLSRAEVDLGRGARLAQTVLSGGCRLQRLETHVRHPGLGADVRLDGAYLLGGEAHADLTSVVTHAGRDGTTSQLTKGVVRDQGRGVFQGRIVVDRGADGTDARMGHHALILSERGEVDAKPELVIYADEVSCAHGNTVGALDEAALFYMQQRGLSDEQARALLIEAFLVEVLDRIEPDDAREVMQAWLTARL